MIKEVAPDSAVSEVDLWERAERYQGAKAALLEAAGQNILTDAAAAFDMARAELRSILEEIWPDRTIGDGRYAE